jgi:hypothetical protein
VPGYPPAPPIGYVMGPSTPGGVTAAAVLSYIQSGLVLIGAIVVLAVGSLFGDLGLSSLQTIITLFGVLNLILTGLFITAGVFVQTGRGRVLLYTAAGLNTAEAIFWLYGYGKVGSNEIWVPLLYLAIPVVAAIVGSLGGVAAWEAMKKGQRLAAAPPGPPRY